MERQIRLKHENSEELTGLLTQLEKHGVRQVGSIEREDCWSRLAGSGLNKAPMNDKNYSYGIVLPTLPDIDFHASELSSTAKVSRCYEYHKRGKHYVIDGQEYYDFIQDLTSKISLPEGLKFMSPKFIGFAIDTTWGPRGTIDPYYGDGSKFEVRGSLSLVGNDPDRAKIKEGVIGGVLGNESDFLESGRTIFPVYRPAVVGRMYHEGMIRTKREFVDSNENPVGVSESSKKVNCLEVIAIYPDKKVLEASKDIDNGLVKAFFTYHPEYQFKWSKSAERHACNYEMSLRKDN